MLKGRRCYCGRLYPNFRCAYCRMADVVSDAAPNVTEDEMEMVHHTLSTETDLVPAEPPTWWTRLSAYGRSIIGRQDKKR